MQQGAARDLPGEFSTSKFENISHTCSGDAAASLGRHLAIPTTLFYETH